MLVSLLHVYRLPPGSDAEFEMSPPTATGEKAVFRPVRDAAALLAVLQEYGAEGIKEGDRLVPLSAPEIVERCCALRNESSGPVAAFVHPR